MRCTFASQVTWVTALSPKVQAMATPAETINLDTSEHVTRDSARFDRGTRVLHALLATSVMLQLALSAVMRVPPGPGLGPFDWHRKAFEIHARVGLVVAAICALHWIWSFGPRARPGAGYFFPWLRREGRRELLADAYKMMRLRRDLRSTSNRAVATIHSLGLLAVTAQAGTGFVTYLAYWVGYGIPKAMLHDVERFHVVMRLVLWMFVCGHILMTLLHYLAEDKGITAIFAVGATSPEALVERPSGQQ